MTVSPSPSPTERWRAMSPGRRAVLSVVAVVAGVNVFLAGLQWVTGGPGPGGERSSSYATAPHGAAAYADLLARRGHGVERLRSRLDQASLDSRTTLVVLEPHHLEDSESEALRHFVADGGRLVAAGRETAPMLRRMLGDLTWSPEGVEQASPLAPTSEVSALGSVRAGAEGSWARTGVALPVLGDDERVLAAAATVGRGRVVLLADPTIVQNRLLGEDGNAAFAISAVGPPGRPVVFAEDAHGYADGEGLGALPSRWRWGLAGAVVAALVWMWSRGKRLGPAEETSRAFPPPRRAYVDAVASTLARTRQPDAAVAPLREAARSLLASRAGLSPEADPEELAEAACRLGGDRHDVARLLSSEPLGSDEDLVRAGRAAAWVRETAS